MSEISIDIDTKALESWLTSIPKRASRRIRGEALQAAGDIILATMVTLAPEMAEEQDPSSNALPPGVLKADLITDVVTSRNGGAYVDIGPTELAGHVCRLQNDGYDLTTHGKWESRKVIKKIPGKFFMEASADETFQAAVDAFTDSVSAAFNAANADSSETGSEE